MSEKILEALMQLFAIIARPASNESDRRIVVESFLKRQLNQELVQQYLQVFDEFYKESQEKQAEKERTGKQSRRISAVAVRVLKICTIINDQLTQDQKIIVIVQLLEFCKSDRNEVSEQELEFIQAVYETFNISYEEYNLVKDFILSSPDQIPESGDLLLIHDEENIRIPEETKVLRHDSLKGHIWVLHVGSANMYFVRYTGGTELYLNGQLLPEDKAVVFTHGGSIRDQKIKPIYYSKVVSQFRWEELEESRLVYEVKDLEYRFKGGKIGIHNMCFEEESGRLVGIMGASGAGKSTLLNVLNGNNKPSSGAVTINGVDIHHEKEKLEGLIGYVSQDDLLIEELTVWDNLYFNAKLCFDDLSKPELEEKVSQVLQNLGLHETRDMIVGSPLNKKISGGQRKRLNIALELIREPSVLFLDEPTSGLSSRDSENILDLLKELALKGKLVFVVIHQPSSDLFKMFDKLIILDTGGYLIYNGNPVDSIIYFKSKTHHANWNESECPTCGNVNPEQVFNILESKVLDEYGKPTSTRKVSPIEWNEFFREHAAESKEQLEPGSGLPKITFRIPNWFKQMGVFIRRDIMSKLANTQYLIITLLEAPILGFFLAYLIKYFNEGDSNEMGYTLFENSNLPVYLFMSVIVAIFMGLTVSAEEIIKDRKILKREAFLNLSWSSYLVSKVLVQFVIAAIQAFTFVIIGNTIMEIRGMYMEYWLILFTCWAMANMMGLLISDSFKTVVTIYILIPFLVIPQIILSGIIVKFDKLNPAITAPDKIPWYGEMITARWGYEALAVNQFMNNDYEKQFYYYDKNMSAASFKQNYWQSSMNNTLSDIRRNLDNTEQKQQLAQDLTLLRNEIQKELQNTPQVAFEQVEMLYPDKINEGVIQAAEAYVAKIKRYYNLVYNEYNKLKDNILNEQRKIDPEYTQQLKNAHFNESLEEFVRNSNDKNRILEYKGELIQVMDPIFNEPEGYFVKAHFYAPVKPFFGIYISTFWTNIMVIWLMTFLLYLALYFRLLKRALDSFEVMGSRFFRKNK